LPGGGPKSAKEREIGKKKWKKEKREEDDRPKTTLRVGTGKKGRAAESSQRRGSLKKRDRSNEKALKAEAALERKTVNLPEYVLCGSWFCFVRFFASNLTFQTFWALVVVHCQ